MSGIHYKSSGYILSGTKPVLISNTLVTGDLSFGTYWNPGNSRWIDTSTNAITITTGTGITFVSTATPYASGGLGSMRLPGNALGFNATSSTFQFGAGDFTVALWLYPTNNPDPGTLFEGASGGGGRLDSLIWYLTSSRTPQIFASGVVQASTSTAVALNTWTHLALCRASGVTSIYVNGNRTNSTSALPNVTTTFCQFGKAGDSSVFFNGYMANYMVIKGRALYIDNFTPPTLTINRSFAELVKASSSAYGINILG